jgi:poly(A) polymerase
MNAGEAGARLPDAPWRREVATRAVLAALTARGQTARFVGGCVRNALIGRAVDDIDIATPDPPETVMALLEAAGIRAVPTGLAHGTVTALAGGRHFEITTLRHDVRTFGRHAEVAFTGDWLADAHRRDFTMNALYADPDGTIHDPVGGLDDLAARRIRFVGDARARIAEDYLRILRFFRFAAWYGEGPLDAAALEAVVATREGLRRLSAERVRAELLKLLSAPDPMPALRAMAATGALGIVVPEADGFDRLARLVALRDVAGAADPLLRLAAMAPVDAAGMAGLAERLRLSNAERDRLVAMAEREPPVAAAMDWRAIRAAIYRLGKPAFRDRALLAWAGDAAPGSESWNAVLVTADDWAVPRFPLTGDDAIALGLTPGPALGRALRAVEGWWVEQDFVPDRDSLLARLGEVAAE